MKYLILTMAILCFTSQASQLDCKAEGEKAEKIMQKRQSEDDLFKTLSLYKEDEDIVFDAYEVPRYDVLGYLGKRIDAFNTRGATEANRKYDEVRDNYDAAVSQFRTKYIKKCFSLK